MKRTLSVLVLLCLLIAGLSAQTITIGTGVEGLNLPIHANQGYSYSQMIYLQSEIGSSMTISKVAFQYKGIIGTENLDIYLGNTTQSAFASTTEWVATTAMSKVFSGNVSVSSGWVEILLDTPFAYDGTSNLVVAVDKNTGAALGYDNYFYGTTIASVNRSMIRNNSSVNIDPAAPGTASSRKLGYANIKLMAASTTPEFSVIPETNNYGSVLINTPVLQNFVIKNKGIGSLDIEKGGLTITGDDISSYTIGNLTFPIHLGPNETITVPVTFSPVSSGSKKANLHIVDNIARSVHDLPLTGSGYEAFAIPFIQDFEGMGSIPPNWSRFNGLLTESSALTPTSFNWTVSNFAGVVANGKGAKINNQVENAWLVTPAINLGKTNSKFTLQFDAALTAYGAATAPDLKGVDDKLAVVISTDGGTTWSSTNTLRMYDNNIGSSNIYNSFTPSKTSVSIAMNGYSGIVKVGFYAESTVSNSDNDLYLDNIKIETSSAIGDIALPNATVLAQNYPNPFNPETTISFNLVQNSPVKLAVYNTKGELVKELVNGITSVGMHSVKFNATNLNSGVYFYKLTTPEQTITNKMLLVK